ncbi:cytosolic enolase 3-like [Plasmopara halstedii]|uniref:phosphopyruvate hydratase n=1 Tax=Plasmopara halstedii TaxID=4781 RepID=A0A0P1B3T5_PLAHL|nr:cytosolic enolase 3-like [Plasmopara halstedii]CEG48946.1 cytosolic enolase 3-like [Plasmopara halstedii]|eukprot:XP_024585315.1 cytosolic enolase 3-like [Plasmopara halstedii]
MMNQMHEVHEGSSDKEEEKHQERDLVEAYVAEHALESTLNDVINQMIITRPKDPILMLSSLLYERATSKRGITFVQVNEVMDAVGKPSILVRLHTGKGVFKGCCSAEAGGITDCEYHTDIQDDSDISISKMRYNGRGYVKIAASAQKTLTEKLMGKEPTDQNALDKILQDLETTLGRNVCLATSLALCRAGAKYADLSLCDFVSRLQELLPENQCLPMPIFSVVNGGALQIAFEFHEALKAHFDIHGVGFTNHGAFGGLTPQFQSLHDLFVMIHAAVDDVRIRFKDLNEHTISSLSVSPLRIDFGVDFAASEFAASATTQNPASSESFTYNTDRWVPGSSGNFKSSEELLDIIRDNIKEFQLAMVVDPFDAGDVKSFTTLHSTLNDAERTTVASENIGIDGVVDGVNEVAGLGGDARCCLQIVGRAVVERHGLTATSDERACNTVLFVPHQFPTVSQLLQAITTAHNLGLVVILGASAGQFGDADVLVALAIGAGIGQVKFGGVLGAESQDRYQKLLIESLEPEAPPYVGAAAYRR